LRLLFDANLSPKLVARLADLFPGSTHIFATTLARFTSDERIWEFAREQGFAIVSADADFLDLAEQHGAPPKVIRIENCRYRTAEIERLLRRDAISVAEFVGSDRGVLILRQPRLRRR
jgi:predicted nuclease of predicted toxin-antitoxin system